jgi:hypothetical protein
MITTAPVTDGCPRAGSDCYLTYISKRGNVKRPAATSIIVTWHGRAAEHRDRPYRDRGAHGSAQDDQILWQAPLRMTRVPLDETPREKTAPDGPR